METETRVGLRGSRDTSVEGRTGGGRRVWVTARRRAAVGRAGCLAKCTLRAKDAGCRGCRMQYRVLAGILGPCRNIAGTKRDWGAEKKTNTASDRRFCANSAAGRSVQQILCRFGCRNISFTTLFRALASWKDNSSPSVNVKRDINFCSSHAKF